MSRRNRIFAGILLVYVLGIAFLLYRITADLDSRYRESAEESLVETANLLAVQIENDVDDGIIETGSLDRLFRALYARHIDAQIYAFHKTHIELRLYITDSNGRVIYDTTGLHVGEDFSRWRDVKLALDGQYGARTTPDVSGQQSTAVLYVGAPIRYRGDIIGMVSVGKPTQSFGQFVDAARNKILLVGATSIVAVILLALFVSVWLVRPFSLVRDYMRFAANQRPSLPRLGRRALGAIGAAFADMRDALAGRSYVEDYVQTLTHELKSPLSGIRGAAELLQEDLPEADRQRFLGNITRETARMQEMVERMLELAALEQRRHLDSVAQVDLRALAEEVAAEVTGNLAVAGRSVRVTVRVEGTLTSSVVIEGDAFLLHRAVFNLVDNAVDFSPDGGEVVIVLVASASAVTLQVRDDGPGMPDYAADRIFDKFFSLPRPDRRKRGTGLGLAFVREIAALHRGDVALHNRPEGGALAVLRLPRLHY